MKFWDFRLAKRVTWVNISSSNITNESVTKIKVKNFPPEVAATIHTPPFHQLTPNLYIILCVYSRLYLAECIFTKMVPKP